MRSWVQARFCRIRCSRMSSSICICFDVAGMAGAWIPREGQVEWLTKHLTLHRFLHVSNSTGVAKPFARQGISHYSSLMHIFARGGVSK
jgi:hypothetical protein